MPRRPPQLPALAIACLAFACLAAGCGEGDAPAADLPAACPRDTFESLVFAPEEEQVVGAWSYWPDPESGHLAMAEVGGRDIRSVPHGLDCAQSMSVSQGEGKGPRVALAGCRGERSVVRVFHDEDGDGVADELAGELVLPRHASIVGITDHAKHGYLAVEETEGAILHLQDPDGDGVPDFQTVWLRHDALRHAGGREIHYESVYLPETRRLLMVCERGCVLSEDPLVVRDRDGDGAPDDARVLPWEYAFGKGPRIADRPEADDTHLELRAPRGSTIEVWLTDAEGNRVSPAADEARVVHCMLDGSGTLAPLRRRLAAGQHLRPYDPAYDIWGPVVTVHATEMVFDDR